ncbi:nuclear factor NF-kappa-B p105 subunit [Nephila pilipes]|uniref:Nuclear factor NF-kappa-B p105 subunit n=1 Tax=Nephila pilipes TaxID=299642 RepID=A0A8X6NAX4_NEPPI|nr:nuclear factor NF-kappa-B p105 subunit [Nephila pilipes]
MPYKNQNHINRESELISTVMENAQNPSCFQSVCGIEALMPENFMQSDESDIDESKYIPYLIITMQPADTFRYRYESEKGSHGGIKGEKYSRTFKCFPEVKLNNAPCNTNIKIKASLYTNEINPKPHVHELTGKNCRNGECLVNLDEDFSASFPSLAIQTRKKEEVLKTLMERKISEYGLKSLTKEKRASLTKEVQEEIKNFNLDSAKLCFEAFFEDDLKYPICPKVFSNPINNQKSAASGDLKINRISQIIGKCSGGDEVFLFCEKVKKEDIKVRFCERDDKGNILWQAFGKFSSADVHHQVAIAFRTPEYKSFNTEAVVFVELFRPSDGKWSESDKPITFKYMPNEELYESSRKRKRVDSLDPSLSPLQFICSKCSQSDEWLENIFDSGNLFDEIPDDFTDISSPSSKIMEYNEITQLILEDKDLVHNQAAFNMVRLDSVCAQMGTVSLKEGTTDKIEHFRNSKAEKTKQKLEDYVDGMHDILKNRKEKTYLYYGPRLCPIQDENGNSMLHLAILEQSENLNFIQTMLEMISVEDINLPNKFKETPVHLAVKGNHFKILFLLLVKGGNPNILDLDGNNCLHLAAQKNYIQCMKLLIPQNEKFKKYKMTEIDTLNYDGMSPLHVAIVNNSEHCVHFLLDAEADVNLRETKCGQSSLHLAIEHPNLIHKILKQPAIDVQSEDFRGYTAVYLACINNGISFENISKEIKNNKHEIIKFLENIHLSQQITEFESYESDTTDSTDYEDAIEDQVLHPEKNFGVRYDSSHFPDAVNCSSITSQEKEYANGTGSETFFMETEKELCKYLDNDGNWKKLADLIEINKEMVDKFDEKSSPGKTVLRLVKISNNICDVVQMMNIFEMVGLDEGVRILQRTCAS